MLSIEGADVCGFSTLDFLFLLVSGSCSQPMVGGWETTPNFQSKRPIGGKLIYCPFSRLGGLRHVLFAASAAGLLFLNCLSKPEHSFANADILSGHVHVAAHKIPSNTNIDTGFKCYPSTS